MEESVKKDNNILFCLVFAAFATIFNVFAFFSPYWIVGKEGIQREFVRLGLWEACFNGYVHPEDYVSKSYYGCWFVYWPEYDYIRDWLNPPWFYAVQMLAIVSLLCNLAAFALIATCLPDQNSTGPRNNVYAIIAQSLAVGAHIVVIVTMGVMSKDRNWMPRPDHNYLSWSFAFAVVGSFFTLFSLFNLFIDYIVHNLAPEFKRKMLKIYKENPLHDGFDNTIRRSNIGSVSEMYGGHPGGSTMYSHGGKSLAGITSGATASVKVREAMSQKRDQYGNSMVSLNSLGHLNNKAGSNHSLASTNAGISLPAVNFHEKIKPSRHRKISSGDSIV